ncbi:MAG: transketolase [Saprospirales bacterium]|jgi:pyruvate/2-oxoglutarate/acetoin dehydrogenase E1 component/TPP-dependent pyruvate/acetoin dehydrogenase alpha subunit|nr:transketolase [Saprospirales bacterium]
MVETKSSPRATPRSKKQTPVSDTYRQEVLRDFRICCLSREASILARKEVLTGRANFGIIGDGKEVAQVAIAKAWKKGDYRSGYYRDQTLLLALDLMTLDEFFGQLYGDPENDKFSGGRQMNCHFATPFTDENGNWLDLKNRYNISSDVSPTAGQMARALGLAFASKKYRELPVLQGMLSDKGNEVTFCTIGDASTSEGAFWETVNAAGVLQVPLAISVWDDGYGISVPKKHQTTKENISEVLRGFAGDGGLDIYQGKAWDYDGLCALYTDAVARMRKSHRPALFHIQEVTQQLGHSTSGDHRRYKSADRLAFEEAFDCNKRMAEWMITSGIADAGQIERIKAEAKQEATAAAQRAFRHYHDAVAERQNALASLLQSAQAAHPAVGTLTELAAELGQMRDPLRFNLVRIARRAVFALAGEASPAKDRLADFAEGEKQLGKRWYSEYLYSNTPKSALKVPVVPPEFSGEAPWKDGYEVLNACFDANFEKYPTLFAFGEDVGHIGDVNQGMRGMQQKYGPERIFDTGIREWTIMGQAIGMAMRGLRPIAEIQYLDYLLYGLSPLSDDLCTLRWRSNNQQAAPAIIRTRGHRLVGVWHAGSPMAMMLGSLRGMYFCVPRNMTQAAGMYNTLLRSDDPAIVVECLNGYRLKERLPDNIGSFTVPLGVPEILRVGSDVTLITYGSCVRVAEEACALLAGHGISVELVDVQTLLPFDLPQVCLTSIRKTNRAVFLDEDFQGGGTGYLLQQVLDGQGAYRYLDSAPVAIAAKDHRPAYGQDGDYFSKPQAEDVFEAVYRLMREADPRRFVAL